MGNALLNQVVHALQQLQGHHGSQARTGSLLLKVLAQGTGVAGRTGQNVWGFTIPWPPSLLGPGLSSSGASTIFPGILSDLTHPDPQSHGSATLQLLRSVSAVAGIERGHRREGSYKGAKSTGWGAHSGRWDDPSFYRSSVLHSPHVCMLCSSLCCKDRLAPMG